jgi:hypothetical protein
MCHHISLLLCGVAHSVGVGPHTAQSDGCSDTSDTQKVGLLKAKVGAAWGQRKHCPT